MCARGVRGVFFITDNPYKYHRLFALSSSTVSLTFGRQCGYDKKKGTLGWDRKIIFLHFVSMYGTNRP